MITPMNQLEHVVLLMIENRSLDNLLGLLYEPDAPRRFFPASDASLAFVGRDSAEPTVPPESKAPRRIGWASLLARVFAVDVTVCRKCGGRMRILEVVDTPDAVVRVLHGARAPPRPPPPGQLRLLH